MGTERRHGPQGLRVYALALRFADQVEEIIASAACGRGLADQLGRAAESVVLNIAEGAAHFTPGQKAKHYRVAQGSAGECIGALDLLRRRNSTLNVFAARRNAQQISHMLTALITQQETRRAAPAPAPAPAPDP
jgi:four helix bundle protein